MQRQILRLAIPNILSNITVPLLGIVDTALMGRMDSVAYLAALAVGGLIFSFLYWSFGFLRMGTTGLTAQALGADDSGEIHMLLWRSLLLGLGFGILCILFQVGVEWISFYLLEAEQEVERLARVYFRIRIYAAPATIGLYALTGWFLGMQNARYPLYLALWINLANIAFNVVFVVQFHMGVKGVAWGTVLAQYSGFLLAAYLLIQRYPTNGRIPSWKQIGEFSSMKVFFSVNRDIFLRTLCLIFSFAFFVSRSALLGTLTLAANQVLLQYYNLLSYGVDGFAFAAESLAGKYRGSGDVEGLRKVVRQLLVWGTGLGLVFALFFVVLGDTLLQVFTDQLAVIEYSRSYVIWLSGCALMGSVAFMWDGVFIGLTETRAMRNTMFFSTFFVFLPIAYWAGEKGGNHGLWLAMLAFAAARGISLSWVWWKRYSQPTLR